MRWWQKSGIEKQLIGLEWHKRWEATFSSSFERADNEFLTEAAAPEMVGSTTVVVVLSGCQIIISNCGDTRAVLCRGTETIPLTVDQKKKDGYSFKVHRTKAWQEEVKSARQGQRDAESKLSSLEAYLGICCHCLFTESELQNMRVEMAAMKRDAEHYSRQEHMELEKRYRELTDLLYYKQTQLEAMASEKAAAEFQLEKEIKRIQEAQVEAERNRASRRVSSWEEDTDIKALEPLPLHHRHMVGSSIQLQKAAKFLDSGAVRATRFLWRYPTARVLLLFYLVFVHLFLMYLLHRLQALYCADSVVDLLLKSGANQYIEFKSIDAIFVCDGEGKLCSVPSSREAIFKDQSLTLIQKTQLRMFFKVVLEHLEAVGSDGGEIDKSRISEEDLESAFVEFLKKMRLPPKIKSIILYAIAMADYDQDNLEDCKDVLKTKDGIDRLALHHSSVGRFSNALGALIYPIYGQGELPQAFCCRAAVKGCLYVLRIPVLALLMDKGCGSYKGVKLASGQDLFSPQLVLDLSQIVPSPLANSSPDFLQDGSEIFGLRDAKGKVARGICITNSSLKPDVSNFLVVYPPKSLYPEQITSIRVLQMGSNLVVCPAGMFVLYLSALCDDAIQGKKLLNEATCGLVSVPISGYPENSSTDQSENMEEGKPTLLWSALYIQELARGSYGSISSTPMPDGNLNYDYLLDASLKLFNKMYPHEEFLPKTTSSDKLEEDDEFAAYCSLFED
ncbi:hypothetical protein F0562_023404 [Nyssa sinensis]|uniref:PPM-type phosphatase domain-containing protein n=1 Tax=Nyssa sinensis TaxID=561372 RepID=A0A5J5BMW5_9ASTE|nr:hypothetical protein F0562_023404 [Nyssa sinensis]